jgi:lipoprotein-releasing system permease protein
MDVLMTIWEGAAALGGLVALCFIVVLVAGIIALTVLYVGSAVVVLERFARVARRPHWIATFALVVTTLIALVGLREWAPEAAGTPWDTWLSAFGRWFGPVALASVACMAIVRIAMRLFSPPRLGGVAALALAVSIGLGAGSGGDVGAAFVPALIVLGVAVLRWLWRRIRDGQGASTPTGWFLRLEAGLLLGPLVALAPESAQGVANDIAGLGLGALASIVVLGLLPLAAGGFMDMRGTAEWFIATRYLVAKRRQVFISAITGICVVGIAAGVWLIIVVLSVMNGFEQTWREEILGNRAHFTVHSGFGAFPDYEGVVERVRQVPGVVAASPYIDADGMIRGRAGEIYSVRVRGVDPASAAAVTSLDEDMVMGSLDALAEGVNGIPRDEAEGPIGPPMVIGNQLAAMLGVGVGDDLLLISPFGGPPTPLGPAPRLKRFRVAGVFKSSFYQYDEVYTYVSLGAAQEFRRAGPVIDGIEALTTDYYRSRRVGAAVEDSLDRPFFTRDWKEYFPAFFQALKTERIMMFLLLTMIMVVAAFVIVATLIMMIMEKSSDIAILKAMGAEDSLIERIFALEGTLIGLLGTVLGVVAGIAVTHRLTWIQDQIEVITGIDTLPASVYQFSTLPSRVDPVQVGIVVTIAMVLSLGATLLPSRQGARLDPAEGLRHE